MEIMIQLPLREVLVFKSVSKAWNNRISDRSFRQRYIPKRKSSSLPLVGLFHYNSFGFNFYPICSNKEGKLMTTRSIINCNGCVMSVSPEGLILWGFTASTSTPNTFYVWSPYENSCISLPKLYTTYRLLSPGFSCDKCDEDGIVHFKVIGFIEKHPVVDPQMEIGTFCSKIGKWRVLQLSPPAKSFFISNFICKVLNGVFYWEANDGDYLVAHDPTISNNQVWLLILPCFEFNIKMRKMLGQNARRKSFTQSSDGLLKCALDNHLSFQIWILKKKLYKYSYSNTIGIDEWILTDTIIYSNLPFNGLGHFPFFLGAFHPQDSRLIYLHMITSTYCCNLETKTVESIEYVGVLPQCYLCDGPLIPYIQPAWPPSLPTI